MLSVILGEALVSLPFFAPTRVTFNDGEWKTT